jgi:hypothetical protein
LAKGTSDAEFAMERDLTYITECARQAIQHSRDIGFRAAEREALEYAQACAAERAFLVSNYLHYRYLHEEWAEFMGVAGEGDSGTSSVKQQHELKRGREALGSYRTGNCGECDGGGDGGDSSSGSSGSRGTYTSSTGPSNGGGRVVGGDVRNGYCTVDYNLLERRAKRRRLQEQEHAKTEEGEQAPMLAQASSTVGEGACSGFVRGVEDDDTQELDASPDTKRVVGLVVEQAMLDATKNGKGNTSKSIMSGTSSTVSTGSSPASAANTGSTGASIDLQKNNYPRSGTRTSTCSTATTSGSNYTGTEVDSTLTITIAEKRSRPRLLALGLDSH